MTFGQVIATARKELGFSQRELALKVIKDNGSPISAQYLNDIERDRRNPPGEPLLEQFARELSLDEDYLYFLAGKYPADMRAGTSTPKQVKAAFRAFRRTLKSDDEVGSRTERGASSSVPTTTNKKSTSTVRMSSRAS